MTYDLSRGLVTTRLGRTLSKGRVEKVLDSVYGEFASNAPIGEHLIKLAVDYHTRVSEGLLQGPDLSQLKKFDYLSSMRVKDSTLRTKGALAMAMIRAEIQEGELSAELVEPLNGLEVLPVLYDRWKIPQKKRSRLQLGPSY